jgi:hypothetical protein
MESLAQRRRLRRVLLSSFNKIDRIHYSMLDVQCSMFDVHQFLSRLNWRLFRPRRRSYETYNPIPYIEKFHRRERRARRDYLNFSFSAFSAFSAVNCYVSFSNKLAVFLAGGWAVIRPTSVIYDTMHIPHIIRCLNRIALFNHFNHDQMLAMVHFTHFANPVLLPELKQPLADDINLF